MIIVGGQSYSFPEKIFGYFGQNCGLYGKVKSINTVKIDSCLSQETRIIETSPGYTIPVIFNYTHNKTCNPQIGQEELTVRGNYVPKVGDMNGQVVQKKTGETVLLKMDGGYLPYVPVCRGSLFQEYYIGEVIIIFILISGIIFGNYFYKKYKHKK